MRTIFHDFSLNVVFLYNDIIIIRVLILIMVQTLTNYAKRKWKERGKKKTSCKNRARESTSKNVCERNGHETNVRAFMSNVSTLAWLSKKLNRVSETRPSPRHHFSPT